MQKRLREACPEMAEYCIENLQGALPAISLVSEAGLTTAYANDQAPDLAFAQQVLGQAKNREMCFWQFPLPAIRPTYCTRSALPAPCM